ncbi:asparaginyl-tRNA synthetase [Mycoplasma ovis str. Michigan]|uniref:Asparagine--tRNA ligase n=1 Tax=Mycoplasma ovis str. Michigan TaxID=1415773 RepID=A0ABN4BPW2_9MOLU|nr:asparagine--tRNA ligase [Mycoplasma ovis]AHC39889.1 asparaginyl-tRNA synthetase [Mycoplasma ovis str. Michigan]
MTKTIFCLLKDANNLDLTQTYSLLGWIRSVQKFNSIGFISLNDGSNLNGIQLIFSPEIIQEKDLSLGDAIQVTGYLQKSKGKEQEWEFRIQELEILKKSTKKYPLIPKQLSLDFLRTQQLVRHRTSIFQAVFEIRRELVQSIHTYLYEHKFFPCFAPILSTNSCEGGAELFKLNSDGSEFFKKEEVLLSVSGQFYCETISNGLGKSYSFGPTFRSEKSNSSSHLAEFWMLELEMAFANLTQLIEFIYKFFIYLIQQVLKNCRNCLKELSVRLFQEENTLIEKLENISSEKYMTLSYSEALNILGATKKLSWGYELSKEDENFLLEKLNTKVLFITKYPTEQKPFYMKNSEDGKVTHSFDMLVWGIGELAGGSEREDNLEVLNQKIKEQNLKADELEWYLQLREFGYASSAGFGLGFERLLMFFTGLKNIKDVSIFPRSYSQLSI